jgi:hypothetical protein
MRCGSAHEYEYECDALCTLSLKLHVTSQTLLKYWSSSSTKRWIVSISNSSLSAVSAPKTKYKPAYLR